MDKPDIYKYLIEYPGNVFLHLPLFFFFTVYVYIRTILVFLLLFFFYIIYLKNHLLGGTA